MLSDIILPITLILFLASIYGYYCLRDNKQRLTLTLLSLFISSLSLWVLSSSIELATQGKAHKFLRSFNEIFSKSEHPTMFILSLTIHSILGLIGITIGVAGIWIVVKRKEFH